MSGGAPSNPAILQRLVALGTFFVGALSSWRSAKKAETPKPAFAANGAKPQAEGFRLSINNLPRPSELPVRNSEESRR